MPDRGSGLLGSLMLADLYSDGVMNGSETNHPPRPTNPPQRVSDSSRI